MRCSVSIQEVFNCDNLASKSSYYDWQIHQNLVAETGIRIFLIATKYPERIWCPPILL